MKIKSKIIATFSLIAVFVGAISWLLLIPNLKSRKSASISKIDAKGIFIGEQILPIDQKEPIQERIGKEIAEAGEKIRLGDRYAKAGDYKAAANAYWDAYWPKYGEKVVAGLLFAEISEKTGEYDKGLIVIDDMLKNGYLSEIGIQKANEIKARLLAAKEAQRRAAS